MSVQNHLATDHACAIREINDEFVVWGKLRHRKEEIMAILPEDFLSYPWNLCISESPNVNGGGYPLKTLIEFLKLVHMELWAMCKLPPKETCGKWTYLVNVGSLDPVHQLHFSSLPRVLKEILQIIWRWTCNHFQHETCNELYSATWCLLQYKFDVNRGLRITKSKLNSWSLYKNTEV